MGYSLYYDEKYKVFIGGPSRKMEVTEGYQGEELSKLV
jgi:hypothetical protein